MFTQAGGRGGHLSRRQRGHEGRRLRLYRRQAERRRHADAAARPRAARAAGPDGRRGAGAPFARHRQAHLHEGRARATVAGCPAIVSRSGYTGEDGFEISIEGKDGERVARALLARKRSAAHRPRRARLAASGSGALPLRPRHRRDDESGRSQSGLVDRQAPQAWTRIFPAAEKIMDGIQRHGQEARRHSARRQGARARRHTPIADKTGRVIGKITSRAASGRA